MSGNGKGSLVSDIVVIGLFLVFLVGGGFFAWQAVASLIGLEPVTIDVSAEMRQWEKSFTDKMEGLFDSQKPKPSGPVTPAGPASGPKAAVKKVEVKTIKLFEADKEIPAVKSRVYSTQFNRQARQIFVEINYNNNNYKITDATVPLVIQYYGPSGQLLTEMKVTAQPKKEWESAYYTRGWGPAEGNSWQVGTHTVKVVLDGDPAGEMKFDIR